MNRYAAGRPPCATPLERALRKDSSALYTRRGPRVARPPMFQIAWSNNGFLLPSFQLRRAGRCKSFRNTRRSPGRPLRAHSVNVRTPLRPLQGEERYRRKLLRKEQECLIGYILWRKAMLYRTPLVRLPKVEISTDQSRLRKRRRACVNRRPLEVAFDKPLLVVLSTEKITDVAAHPTVRFLRLVEY